MICFSDLFVIIIEAISSMHINSVIEQGFFHEFAFQKKAFQNCWKRCQISNLNLNFVASLIMKEYKIIEWVGECVWFNAPLDT